MSIPHPISGSYPVRNGNAVRPLIDGVPTFRRIGEAIDEAQHSVWLTVAYCAPDFRMPDSRGALFDVLDKAAARGLDVRVIFWRPNPEYAHGGRTFSGSSADRDRLRARGSMFQVRWDRAHGHYLHHQQSWLIDAGQPSEVAFVGGINLTAQAIGAPGHPEGYRHDTMSRSSDRQPPTCTTTSFSGGTRRVSVHSMTEGGATPPTISFRSQHACRVCEETASSKFNRPLHACQDSVSRSRAP